MPLFNGESKSNASLDPTNKFVQEVEILPAPCLAGTTIILNEAYRGLPQSVQALPG